MSKHLLSSEECQYMRDTDSVMHLRQFHEYLIIMNNAYVNKHIQALERKMVSAMKPKGMKMVCDMCNKDITKTPDKARHIAKHFGDGKLPVEWEKYVIVKNSDGGAQ